MESNITVNAARLRERLEIMAGFGGTAGGGVTRLALGDEDRDGRRQLEEWFAGAGCEMRVDAIGNMFAVYPGLDRSLDPVLTGSHNDTQPCGGRFDGTLGVIAGLEVVSTLNERGIRLRRDLVVANWTNEEGTRFTPGCTGSGVWAGVLDLEGMYALKDQDGRTLGGELERIGYLGRDQGPGKLHAAFELHIEQGPVLDRQGLTIGIPEGIVSPRWYDVDVHGEANHAGSTPMAGRRDAVCAFARMCVRIREIASGAGEVVATVGEVAVTPNSRNVVPGHVHFTIDVRGWDVALTDRVCADIEGELSRIAAEDGCSVRFGRTWEAARADFHPALLDLIEDSARELGYSRRRMYSGASHDMIYVNQVAPGAMIFVPSIGGKSHSEIENTSDGDCAAGANVLLRCLLKAGNKLEAYA